MTQDPLRVAVLSKIDSLLRDATQAVANLQKEPDFPARQIDLVACDLADPLPILKDAAIILADPPLLAPYINSGLPAAWIQSTFAGVDKLIKAIKQNAPSLEIKRYEERLTQAIQRLDQVRRSDICELMALHHPPEMLTYLFEGIVVTLTGIVPRVRPEWRSVLKETQESGFLEKLKRFQPHFLKPGVVKYVREHCIHSQYIDKSTCDRIHMHSSKFLEWMNALFEYYDEVIVKKEVPTQEMNFQITKVSGIFGGAMAEYCIGHIISTERQFASLRKSQESAKWGLVNGGAYSYRKLKDISIFILGTGDIGKEVGRAAKCAFNMKVYGFSQSGKKIEHFDGVAKGYTEFVEYARSADYVINTLPSTSKTRGLLNPSTLSSFKRGCIFINIGRGDIATESDLIDALNTGKLGGAVLDVFSQEPLNPESPLWSMPNVVITPHVSGISYSGDVVPIFAKNLKHFVLQEPLTDTVNLAEEY